MIEKIAFYQNRRDEAPNQELARELAETGDADGIREIAEGLRHSEEGVRSDCLKTLYEIGYLKPELIGVYAGEFLSLLHSRNNRMVWGAMIALSTIAHVQADLLYPHVAEIQQVMQQGSVITRDNGVKVLAAVASQNDRYCSEILPYLLQHLKTCRPKDVPQHAEAIAPAIDAAHAGAFRSVLESRLGDLSPSQAKRVTRLVK